MVTISRSRKHRSATFRKVRAGFLTESGLPFSEVLPPDRIEHTFAKHNGMFGLRGAIYSTVTTVWAFLSQVLSDGKEASCQAAVARISVQQQLAGLPVPSADTGDYCHARAKLKEDALRDLVTEVAEELEAKAVSGWLWHDRHVKLVDGFTFTMPDTEANQAAYPQQSSQKAGVGFPIARACASFPWLPPASATSRSANTRARRQARRPCSARCSIPCRRAMFSWPIGITARS